MTAVSMVVLAYNDAPALPGVVQSVAKALAPITRQHEIIVVDDGSSDDTQAIVDRLAETYDVVSVRHDVNRGVGAAFRTGVQVAQHEVVGYVDGDGQFSGDDLADMLHALESADAVSGRRVRRADPIARCLASAGYNWIARSLFELPLADINCALKLFSRRFIDAAGLPDSAGAFYDTEFLVKGLASRMRVATVPVRHFPRRHGRAAGASPTSMRGALMSVVDENMDRYRRRDFKARVLNAALRSVAKLA